MTPEELQADAVRRHLELQREHAPSNGNGSKADDPCRCYTHPGSCPVHDESRDFMPAEEPATNTKIKVGQLLGIAADALAQASALMVAEGQGELKE